MYQLDFDQVAEAGFRSRHRATFPAAQLDHTTDGSLRRSAFVQTHERYHHGQWNLPLYDREVRWWLKAIIFTQPPFVNVGGVDVTCSKPVVGKGVPV